MSAVESFSAVVVGAGHAGLATSRVLSDTGIDHVVLERGDVANSWRHERWDSLRLLTPNWLLRLPGHRYEGADPDGYMSAQELARFLDDYAARSRAPLRTRTEVTSLRAMHRGGYELTTSHGVPGGSARCLRARAVVIATGATSAPRVPPLAAALPAGIHSVTTLDYRNPQSLPEGGVLVVGASASGLQLADELKRAGRHVVLSAGEHVRLPRIYRGRDILWWMDSSGVWNQHYGEIEDLERARRLPSPQLVGTPDRSTLDLNVLMSRGIEVVGRLAAIRDGRALFSGGLANVLALADLKLERLLDGFDAWHVSTGSTHDVGPVERFEPVHAPAKSRLSMDLASGEIRTILWATGYRPNYAWLQVPGAVGPKGELQHDGGIIRSAPGLYAIGLPVLRRRKSTFVHGAEDDARDLVEHLHSFLAQRPLCGAQD